MIYAYIRVSTDKQTNENQEFQIRNFCKANHITIDKWIGETISAGKDLKKRKLHALLTRVKERDIIIACEISRLGRNLLEVMGILSHCITIGCQVWTIKDNYRLGIDIQSKVLAFAFALSAEIERQLISQRTKQSLQRLKSEGKSLGRKKGARNKAYRLDNQLSRIRGMKMRGMSNAQIAHQVRCSRTTMIRFLHRNDVPKLRF